MVKKISRIFELLKNPEIRNWMLFKLFHPKDCGPALILGTSPEYLSKLSFDQSKTADQLELPKLKPVAKIKLSVYSYELASKAIELNEKNVDSFFSEEGEIYKYLEDAEDREALYRFSGLLRTLEGPGVSELCEKLIESWINEKKLAPENEGAYTISERLSNLGLFLCRTRAYENWSSEKQLLFTKKISADVSFLLENLEYMGEALTSNHLTNNGRGLLWAGLILQNESLYHIGNKIVKEETKRIVQKDGMIREGSSHYQFLYTRNIFESFWISSIFDKNQPELLGMLQKLSKGCAFFKIGESIPFFGDISPDFPPPWFFQVSTALNTLDRSEQGADEDAKGWASHFFNKMCSEDEKVPTEMDEYTRLELGQYTIFSRCNHSGFPLINGHVHCDSAAPVVFYKGKEILCDTGRPSYRKESDHWMETSAHNSFVLNNKPLEILQRGFFGPAFQANRFGKISSNLESDKISFLFENFFNGAISIRRDIFLKDGKLVFSFTLLNGTKNSEIDLFLYCCEKLEVSLSEGSYLIEGSRSIVDGASSKYGEKESLDSLHFSSKIKVGTPLEVTINPLN